MQPAKLIVILLGVVGGTVLFLTARDLQSIRKDRAALASTELRQRELRDRLAKLEMDTAANEKRAKEIERDNALLNAAMEQARQADAAKAQKEVAPISPAELEERFKRARSLAQNGDPTEALRELLWCYDEGLPRLNGTARRRQSSGVVTGLAQLGERYPAAQAALRERLELARQRVLSPTDDTESVPELSMLARALKDQTTLVALYDQLPPEDSRRKALGVYGFEDFIAARRYNDALAGQNYAAMSSFFEISSQQTGPMRGFAISRTVENIEVLAGAGDTEHARQLGERLLKFDNSPETRMLLQKHFERAGHPELLGQLPP